MTYLCENCNETFTEPILVEERHSLPGPWAEVAEGCPYCGVAGMIREVQV